MNFRSPLEWPAGWPRTAPDERTDSRYRISPSTATDDLENELSRLAGSASLHSLSVVTTNCPVSTRGRPYAGSLEDPIQDPGVAVYFTDRAARQMALACDAFRRPYENVRALSLAIGAMRLIQRTGASGLIERAYAGFEALPPAGASGWRAALGLAAGASLADAERAARTLRQRCHPDKKGGSVDEFRRITAALEQARRELQP